MYFLKTFKAGGENYDPRQKIWAEFKCSFCGEKSYIDITREVDTFDFSKDRYCSHCGLINADDRVQNMKAQLEKLTHEKSRIEIEIEKLERELNEHATQGATK